MTLTTLVTGASASAREAAVASVIDTHRNTAVLLEGFPAGSDELHQFTQYDNIKISYIAAGCLCCTGNLVMRVTLNRVLRNPPEQLFIVLANPVHSGQLKAFLTHPPYDGLMTLTEDLHA